MDNKIFIWTSIGISMLIFLSLALYFVLEESYNELQFFICMAGFVVSVILLVVSIVSLHTSTQKSIYGEHKVDFHHEGNYKIPLITFSTLSIISLISIGVIAIEEEEFNIPVIILSIFTLISVVLFIISLVEFLHAHKKKEHMEIEDDYQTGFTSKGKKEQHMDEEDDYRVEFTPEGKREILIERLKNLLNKTKDVYLGHELEGELRATEDRLFDEENLDYDKENKNLTKLEMLIL